MTRLKECELKHFFVPANNLLDTCCKEQCKELHHAIMEQMTTELISLAAFSALDIDIFCRQYSLSDNWRDYRCSADFHAVLTQSWSHNKWHWIKLILRRLEHVVQQNIFMKMSPIFLCQLNAAVCHKYVRELKLSLAKNDIEMCDDLCVCLHTIILMRTSSDVQVRQQCIRTLYRISGLPDQAFHDMRTIQQQAVVWIVHGLYMNQSYTECSHLCAQVLACQQLYCGDCAFVKLVFPFPSPVIPAPDFPFKSGMVQYTGMPLIVLCGYLAILSSIKSGNTADVVDSCAQQFLMICECDTVEPIPSTRLLKEVIYQFLIIRKFLHKMSCN
jgi:hypothetical protein